MSEYTKEWSRNKYQDDPEWKMKKLKTNSMYYQRRRNRLNALRMRKQAKHVIDVANKSADPVTDVAKYLAATFTLRRKSKYEE